MGRRPRRGSPGVSRGVAGTGFSRDSGGAIRWRRAPRMPWDRRASSFQTVSKTVVIEQSLSVQIMCQGYGI